jgi:hypothetical protein
MKRDEARQLVGRWLRPRRATQSEEPGVVQGWRSWQFRIRRTRVVSKKFSPNCAESHAVRIIRRLERDVFPWIGSRNAGQIGLAMVLAVLRRIEERGAIETAHRARENCSPVFRYAVATQRAERDPTTDLRGAIPLAKVHFQ